MGWPSRLLRRRLCSVGRDGSSVCAQERRRVTSRSLAAADFLLVRQQADVTASRSSCAATGRRR